MEWHPNDWKAGRPNLKYSRNSSQQIGLYVGAFTTGHSLDTLSLNGPFELASSTLSVDNDHYEEYGPSSQRLRGRKNLAGKSPLTNPEETNLALQAPSSPSHLTNGPISTNTPRKRVPATTAYFLDDASWGTSNKGVEPNSSRTEVYDKFYTPENQHFYSKSLYEPLNPMRLQIRVVRVFPRKPLWEHFDNHPDWNIDNAAGIANDLPILACQIQKTAVSSIDHNYSTVSYCAGDLRDTKLILVNGVPFNAFSNLEHAMECVLDQHQSTEKDKGCLLWLDQICINQSDKQELGEQVQFMREIYLRSKQTFVCLSTARNTDCLSWIPRVPTQWTRDNAKPKKDTFGVVSLKHLLLDFLIGKGLGGGLRTPESHSTTSALEPATCAETLEVFMISLKGFMTNKWWQRSWVYQEFISGKSVHVLSGSTSVPWSELAPLVEFICEDLDPFMESIRVYFESMVTEGIKSKIFERKRSVEEKKRQQEKQKWEAAEKRRREEEAEKKILEEQNKKRQEEVKRRYSRRQQMRQLIEEREEERAAETQYQQLLQDYQRQLATFESERLRQWNEALNAQQQRRLEYAAQQKLNLQQEIMDLENGDVLSKGSMMDKKLRLHREKKMMKRFREEVLKPMEDQIRDARKFISDSPDKKDCEADNRCGGRILAPGRIAALIDLDQVPRKPTDFAPQGCLRPVQPQRPVTFRSRRVRNSQSTQNIPSVSTVSIESGSFLEEMLPLPYSQPSPSSPLATPRLLSQFSYLSDDQNDINTVEEHKRELGPDKLVVETSLEQLGASEIEQRNRITTLQTEFCQLDRSAIASVAKGKQNFKISSDLKALLQHSRNCEASDSRDRVYAFLGLAHKGYNIIPDYTNKNDVIKVLIETAKCIIRFDKSLDILQHVHRGRDNLGYRLPSWVPDWTSRESETWIDKFTWDRSRLFDAAKGLSPSIEFGSATGDDCHDDLKVRGIFVDFIESGAYESPSLDQSLSLLTRGGYSVIGPKSAYYGDEIWVLYGSTRPVILRRNGNDLYGYLGDVLIYDQGTREFSDIMFGRMVDRVQDEALDTFQEKSIWIM